MEAVLKSVFLPVERQSRVPTSYQQIVFLSAYYRGLSAKHVLADYLAIGGAAYLRGGTPYQRSRAAYLRGGTPYQRIYSGYRRYSLFYQRIC